MPARGLEFHIAHQAAVRLAIDADINDYRPGFYPLARYKTGLANCHDYDVGTSHMRFEVAGEAMTNRGGGPRQQEFETHRAADNIGCADNDRVLAGNRNIVVAQQVHDSQGGAGAKTRDSLGQAADVIRVKAVDILARVDALDDDAWIDRVGQRQLNQHTIHAFV